VIRINLLPREERTRRRTLPKIQIPAVGAALPFVVVGVVAAAIGVTHTNATRRVANLQSEVAELRREQESYAPQLEKIRQITQKRQEVRNRLDIIANLDQERYYRVQLMDEVARCVPENLWLTKVQELPDGRFAIEGVTFSNFIVARFMQDLESASHWKGVELGIAEQGRIEGYDVVKFTLASGAQP